MSTNNPKGPASLGLVMIKKEKLSREKISISRLKKKFVFIFDHPDVRMENTKNFILYKISFMRYWLSILFLLPNFIGFAQASFGSLREQIQGFTHQKNMSTEVCFLLDLRIHNGKKRFFVYDIQKDSILQSGLVTHGDCGERYLSTVRYSNQPGSQCSSVGRYKVGVTYRGIFGKSYRLHGLDSSNSNALKRALVIHSHSCIPETEIYPDQICNSQGCTTVAPAFLKTLSSYIDRRKKPILLWVLDRR